MFLLVNDRKCKQKNNNNKKTDGRKRQIDCSVSFRMVANSRHDRKWKHSSAYANDIMTIC